MARTSRASSAVLDRQPDDEQKGRREDSRRGNAPPARSASEERGSTPPVESQPVQKRGRGRPKEDRKTMVVSVRLPSDLLDKLDEIVKRSGHLYRDRAEFIRQTLAVAATFQLPSQHLPQHTAAIIPPGEKIYARKGLGRPKVIGYLQNEIGGDQYRVVMYEHPKVDKALFEKDD